MTTSEKPPVRSWLYVPGHKERMIEKSFGLAADAVIYDFEDAVPLAEKQTARDTLTRMLSAPPQAGSPRRYIRMNHPRHADLFAKDLACAVRLHVEGIAVPKMESAAEVLAISEAVGKEERAAGLEQGSLRLKLLVESPKGFLNAHEIAAASERTIAISFGAEDFSVEMGLPLVKKAEAREMLYARSAFAIAVAAAGVQPIDMIWTDLGHNELLAAEAEQARRLGFSGKAAIHPDQIDPINRAFTPDDEEVSYAREIMGAYNQAVAEGTGVINYKGNFLEEPVIARARRILKLVGEDA
ncbi:MAG: CoA ester lyase [Dehalococcoidia bacterium]